jgi:hypothetical protein
LLVLGIVGTSQNLSSQCQPRANLAISLSQGYQFRPTILTLLYKQHAKYMGATKAVLRGKWIAANGHIKGSKILKSITNIPC